MRSGCIAGEGAGEFIAGGPMCRFWDVENREIISLAAHNNLLSAHEGCSHKIRGLRSPDLCRGPLRLSVPGERTMPIALKGRVFVAGVVDL